MPHRIEAWLGYNYDGRAGRHSNMKHTAEHFNGVGYDHKTQEEGIYKLKDKDWAADVDKSKGNYDYL